jgi:hypothetical protein
MIGRTEELIRGFDFKFVKITFTGCKFLALYIYFFNKKIEENEVEGKQRGFKSERTVKHHLYIRLHPLICQLY